MTIFSALIAVIAVSAIFFYIGMYAGTKVSNHMVISQIDNTQRLLIGSVVYRVYKHTDLKEVSGLPDVLMDVPVSTNKDTHNA